MTLVPDSTMARPADRADLLVTKLAPPIMLPGKVDRDGLLHVVPGARGLVLVSAPPGYGKTTLVTAWLERQTAAAGWLTLDEGDNDPAIFLAYLAAAVRRALPGVKLELGDTTRISAATVAPVINVLSASAQPVVLVLDDYQLVTNATVHELVGFLIGHLPAEALVVLVTRHDPPLPLARLRARGLLTEIRAADLRFATPDTARFLSETMGLDVPSDGVERLTERTEGWIAGLQLAALSMRGTVDMAAFIEAFGSSDRYIFDYLTDEALAIQPDEVRDFLEATCILDRLSGPLCNALTGRTDGAEMLSGLAKANVFVTPLDERREWYRYHRLFADLVASGLPGERRTTLHRVAGAWFAGAGLAGEAIRQYLAAQEPAAAAPLIARAAEGAIARGEFRSVTAWCEALPHDALAEHPDLVVLDAWARFFTGDIAGSERALGSLAQDGSAGPGTEARRACLEAWFANRRDRGDAQALARRAIAGIPETDRVFRSLAFTTLGESTIGRETATAAAAFAEAHRLAEPTGWPTLVAGTAYSLAITHLVLGQRRAAKELCLTTLAEAASHGPTLPNWAGMIHLPLGVALFEADAVDQARQALATGRDLVDRAGLRVTMLGAAEWYEILGDHLVGDRDAAWSRLESVRRDAERAGIARVVTGMALLAAEMLLLEGQALAARAKLEALPPMHGDVLGMTRDRSRLTWARVLLAAGDAGRAIEIAQALADEQRGDGRSGRLMAVLMTLAHARDRLGASGESAAAAAEAVTIAAPEGYRRVFLDGVFPSDGLLTRVRHVAPDFVDGLLARSARSARSEAVAVPGGNGHLQPAPGRSTGPPIEPLSVRELEVLRLVAAGLSNDEIGRALFISTGTAKWHVHNLLGKVGARNRVGLVAEARGLGFV